MRKSLPDVDPRAVRARQLADQQGGVVSRRQLYALGITRWQVAGEVRARRWCLVGDQSLCLHTGPISQEGHWWAAVFQGGPRARLDGASSLIAGGLKRFDHERIRVSVPRGARVRRTADYDIRQTRRWREDDRAPGSGVPRTRPAVAAVHAALWARSDRQADLLLMMPVQQGLVTPAQLGEQLLLVRRHRRRAGLHATVLELAGGVRSLSELDVVRGCRDRGLPEPDKQALIRSTTGSYYLDFRWKAYAVTLEVDGIQHTWVEHHVAEALRHNTIALSRDTVLRLPVMGLRACPGAFFDQIEQALTLQGWVRPAA